jgi:type VI protein secretion system component Hcp
MKSHEGETTTKTHEGDKKTKSHDDVITKESHPEAPPLDKQQISHSL